MKKRVILITILLFSSQLFGYDVEKAKSFNDFYSHMTQKACADSTLFIAADTVMKFLKEKKNILLLDVRTDAEASVVGLTADNSLHIPIEHLFNQKELHKLPNNTPIMILCHSGTRATMAAVGLKMIGVKNVQVVKGGIVALTNADNPKNAPRL